MAASASTAACSGDAAERFASCSARYTSSRWTCTSRGAAMPTRTTSPRTSRTVTVAVYVNDSLGTAAAAVTDLKLSAYAGAAIGLVPAGGAEAAIEDRELAPSVKDNLDEILNIISALFNTEGAPHLKLYASHGLGETPPTDISALIRALGNRLDLKVTIAGYGTGSLSIIVA